MSREMGPVEVERSDEYYPTAHIETDEKIDFPHEGIMEVRYKKTASSMSETNGKMRYSCTFELREILDIESEDTESEEKSDSKKTEDALDSHAREYMKKKGY